VEGAVKFVIGPFLIVAGILFARRWWKRRDQRRERGVLPLMFAGMWVDERGQPASISQILRSFLGAWEMFAAFVFLLMGAGFLLSGGQS
jgi:hypothetical protein